MYLTNLIENRTTVMCSAALILVPFYIWRRLYTSYKHLKNRYDEAVLFHKRHNCVVMYSGLRGMRGWPPNTERVKLDLNKKNCIAELHEPTIYFIDTAKKSLELACMLIGVNAVFQALIRAHQKGVRVRVLLNFEHSESKVQEIRNLLKEGIEVLTYVSQGMVNIMHYKYIVKDYTKCGGFISTGSLNLTDSGFINNYEDVVFTSNNYVVKAFHENFEECWNFAKLNNEDFINQTALLDANLI